MVAFGMYCIMRISLAAKISTIGAYYAYYTYFPGNPCKSGNYHNNYRLAHMHATNSRFKYILTVYCTTSENI